MEPVLDSLQHIDIHSKWLFKHEVARALLWNVFLGSEYNSVYTTARPLAVKNKVIVPGTGGTFFIIAMLRAYI